MCISDWCSDVCSSGLSRKTPSPPRLPGNKPDSAQASNMLGHFGVHSLRCRLVLIDRLKLRSLAIHEAELRIMLDRAVPATFRSENRHVRTGCGSTSRYRWLKQQTNKNTRNK